MNPTTVSRVLGALTATAAAATLLAGCGEGSSHPNPATPTTISGAQAWAPPAATSAPAAASASPAPTAAGALPAQFASVDRSNPDAVARAVLTIWFTWAPADETDSTTAQLRAAPLLTSTLVAQLRIPMDGQGQGGNDVQWQQWASAGDRLVPTITEGAEPVPPSTDQTAYRQYVIDQATVAPDGQVSGHQQEVVDVILTNLTPTVGWRVAQVTPQA